VPHEVLELCDGVDLLIHDAQHTTTEWSAKRDWGHCTVDYAIHVARESGAKRLALFHHDPGHGDDMIDRIRRDANETASHIGGPEVIAASEGMCVDLDPHSPPS
jgi:ribonuclease BN (tRNA processing enzyme)